MELTRIRDNKAIKSRIAICLACGHTRLNQQPASA